jgi:hypothetical protein
VVRVLHDRYKGEQSPFLSIVDNAMMTFMEDDHLSKLSSRKHDFVHVTGPYETRQRKAYVTNKDFSPELCMKIKEMANENMLTGANFPVVLIMKVTCLTKLTSKTMYLL